MRKAIVSGSFDPITLGHLDLIRRGALLFDEVVVVILANAEKKNGMFSANERLLLCEKALDGIGNVRVMLWDGLTSDAAREVGATFILRGARGAVDFDYESSLAAIMKRFDSSLETVILPATPEVSMVSSTYAREVIRYHCDLSKAVPESIIPLISSFTEGK